jgi:integrase
MKKPEFPKEIKRGSVSVIIYKTPSKGYVNYTLAYYQDGHRKREYSADYPAILKRAEEVLDDLNDGKPMVEGVLKTAERTEFVRAKNVLQSRNVALPLDVVARHYAEAVKLLGNDLVIEAAREYAKRHPVKLPLKSVVAVVDEFIEAKRAKGVSRRYMEDLVYRLGQFKDCIKSNIGQVDADEIRMFLDGLTKANGEKVSARSYNNFRLALVTLFEFAKKRKYLPADWNEFGNVDMMKDNGGAIEIFTPEELAQLLNHAPAELVPFLTLGGFAGLRSAEIERLDWKDIRFETGFVVVEAGKAKTASRRQIEMSANLRAWLTPYTKKTGKVMLRNDDQLYKALRELSATAKVPWKNNALRHSYISYRVAESGDVNRTALEAGNSPAMIFSNYRELVTPQEAKKWFSILPSKTSPKQKTMAGSIVSN